MAINVVPTQYLTDEEIKGLQKKLDLMVQEHQREYTEATDRHFAELKELKEKQNAEERAMLRADPDLSFAKAAGLVKWRTRA